MTAEALKSVRQELAQDSKKEAALSTSADETALNVRKAVSSLQRFLAAKQKTDSLDDLNALWDDERDINLLFELKVTTGRSRAGMRSLRVPLPHSFRESGDCEICVITRTKDIHKWREVLLRDMSIRGLKRVLSLKQLLTEYRTADSRSSLCDLVDLFVVHPSVASVVCTKLGPLMRDRNKSIAVLPNSGSFLFVKDAAKEPWYVAKIAAKRKAAKKKKAAFKHRVTHSKRARRKRRKERVALRRKVRAEKKKRREEWRKRKRAERLAAASAPDKEEEEETKVVDEHSDSEKDLADANGDDNEVDAEMFLAESSENEASDEETKEESDDSSADDELDDFVLNALDAELSAGESEEEEEEDNDGDAEMADGSLLSGKIAEESKFAESTKDVFTDKVTEMSVDEALGQLEDGANAANESEEVEEIETMTEALSKSEEKMRDFLRIQGAVRCRLAKRIALLRDSTFYHNYSSASLNGTLVKIGEAGMSAEQLVANALSVWRHASCFVACGGVDNVMRLSLHLGDSSTQLPVFHSVAPNPLYAVSVNCRKQGEEEEDEEDVDSGSSALVTRQSVELLLSQTDDANRELLALKRKLKVMKSKMALKSRLADGLLKETVTKVPIKSVAKLMKRGGKIKQFMKRTPAGFGQTKVF